MNRIICILARYIGRRIGRGDTATHNALHRGLEDASSKRRGESRNE